MASQNGETLMRVGRI